MIKYSKSHSICFDDILLVPQYSNIETRKSIDVSMHGYNLPIVASPMDTVCGSEMAKTIADNGGIGIIHRYMNMQDRLYELENACILTHDKNGIGIAISSAEAFDESFIKSAISFGCTWFCIDTANGHNNSAISATSYLRKTYPDIKIMVGNVSTADGFMALARAGADAVRVGIGGGATCKTRIVTGHGMPTLQSIVDCYESKKYLGIETLIVADGGIRNSGDVVKAFAAGADLVMLGSMLAGTDESPGEVINGYKSFRGMASYDAQISWRGSISVDEGVSTMIEYKGSVKNIFDQIKGGIQSGCSYTGVDKLSDLCEYAIYAETSVLSKNESIPHIERQ